MTFSIHLSPKLLSSACTLAMLCATASVLHAQPFSFEEDTWTESATVPPVKFSTDVLQPIDMGAPSALSFGIDPASLEVGEDGVVRYVMVARSSSGALNVFYQGIRCTTAETKTYARLSDKREWNTSQDIQWKALSFSGPTRPAMMLARQGVCDGRSVTGNPNKILSSLKAVRIDNH